MGILLNVRCHRAGPREACTLTQVNRRPGTFVVHVRRWTSSPDFLAMCGDGLMAAAATPPACRRRCSWPGLAGSLVHCVGMCGPFVLGQVMADAERPGDRPLWRMASSRRRAARALPSGPFHDLYDAGRPGRWHHRGVCIDGTLPVAVGDPAGRCRRPDGGPGLRHGVRRGIALQRRW